MLILSGRIVAATKSYACASTAFQAGVTSLLVEYVRSTASSRKRVVSFWLGYLLVYLLISMAYLSTLSAAHIVGLYRPDLLSKDMLKVASIYRTSVVCWCLCLSGLQQYTACPGAQWCQGASQWHKKK